MIALQTYEDFAAQEGCALGNSAWLRIDQARIQRFADATGDHSWIHVDVERALREMPGGKTIAHGFLTLSLVPALLSELLAVAGCHRLINYGVNRVRFIGPVPVDTRVRLTASLRGSERVAQGIKFEVGAVVEREGSDRPAAVVDLLLLAEF